MTLMMELKQQRREGVQKGKELAMINAIRKVMEKFHLSAKEVMDTLEIPAAEQKKYAAQV